MTQVPPDQDALAALIKDRSDEEINDAIVEAGIDTVLDQIFEAMAERFNPSAATGQTATVQWDITAVDTTHAYHLSVADGVCTGARGAADSPRLTLGLSIADFLRFASGELNGMGAFMAGKLRLTGDLSLAQSMQTWFA